MVAASTGGERAASSGGEFEGECCLLDVDGVVADISGVEWPETGTSHLVVAASSASGECTALAKGH